MEPGILFYMSLPWLMVCVLGVMVVFTDKERRRNLPVNRLDTQIAFTIIAIITSYRLQDELAVYLLSASIILLIMIRVMLTREKVRST